MGPAFSCFTHRARPVTPLSSSSEAVEVVALQWTSGNDVKERTLNHPKRQIHLHRPIQRHFRIARHCQHHHHNNSQGSYAVANTSWSDSSSSADAATSSGSDSSAEDSSSSVSSSLSTGFFAYSSRRAVRNYSTTQGKSTV